MDRQLIGGDDLAAGAKVGQLPQPVINLTDGMDRASRAHEFATRRSDARQTDRPRADALRAVLSSGHPG